MEYQETELEMLKREISRKDESLARQRLQIEELDAENAFITKERDDAVSHIKDVLEPRNLRINEELGKQSIKVSDLEYEVEQLREEIDGKDATMLRWGIRFDDLADKLNQRRKQLKDGLEAICELSEVKNDEIDGLKADLEHAMVYLEGHQGREQKLKKIIRDITSDYLDILSDKDGVIEELNQLVKDLS